MAQRLMWSIGGPRTLAAIMMTMAVLHLEQLPAHLAAAPFLGVLFGAVVFLAGTTAACLFYRPVLEARITAGFLAASTAFGYLLSRTVGLPGALDLQGHWTAAGALELVLSAAVLIALAASFVVHRRIVTERNPNRPYAVSSAQSCVDCGG